MESVNAALKNSLTSPEIGFWDDACLSPVVKNGVVSEDDYVFVDDLLDFSKAEQIENEGVNDVKVENDGVLVADVKREVFEAPPVAVHENELSVPVDELAELEWLSNFVDDSTPGYSLTLPPPQKPPVKLAGPRKSGVRVWPLSDSSTSSSSSSRTFVMCSDVTHSAESLMKPPLKKPKTQHGERRCSHCLVQKTPQWRTGPLGAKTLCNACGVRFKSGRLLPEYRPAVSPTFSSEKHSNSHRKVMEMRRKKEGDGGGGFGKAVEIF